MGTSCCCDKRTKEKGDLEFRNPPALMSDRLNSTEYDRHNAAKKIKLNIELIQLGKMVAIMKMIYSRNTLIDFHNLI